MGPTMRRRILLVLLVLPACAANIAGWETKPHAPPLPAVFVDATPAQIQRACPAVPNVIGCAVRNYAAGVCYIYVEPDTPKWLATHELTHCAGFNHL